MSNTEQNTELIKIYMDKYPNGDWFYIADISSNKLSKDERNIMQLFLPAIAKITRSLNYKGEMK